MTPRPYTATETAMETTLDPIMSSVAYTTPLSDALTIFLLSVIVGYYVIWGVTPALHSPLMGITNAISSVIIVGALLAAGVLDSTTSHEKQFVSTLGLVAIFLSSVNIFGGFIVTWRMLSMFRQKATPKKNQKKT